MTRLQLANGDDHPDAAHKLLLDAKALLKEERSDGAAYLSGYVVECALKSVWLLETGLPAGNMMPWAKQGHNLTYLANQISTLASFAGAKTARYLGAATKSLSSTGIIAWTPNMRYRSAMMPLADSQAWCQTADGVFHETIHQMRLDGVL